MTGVALLRLPIAEVSLLRNMFHVVASRGLLYEVADTPEKIAVADLVIIDGESQTAMTLWATLKVERPNVTGILVSRKPVEGDGQLWIQRPLNSMKILSALGRADVTRHPTSVRTKTDAVNNTSSIRGTNVLVIDDSATVRKQLEIALEAQGVKVQCADSGEAGLHMLAAHNFDLIFLDVMLPGADGYQICKTIKKNKQRQRTPVVMLTSKSSPFDRVKGSLAGCDSYLTKPVELRKLIEVLHKNAIRSEKAAIKNEKAVISEEQLFVATGSFRAIEI